MKQQKSFRWATIALSVILATTMIVAFSLSFSKKSRNGTTEGSTTEMIELSIKTTIDGRAFLVRANVNDRGPKTEDYIREIVNAVARFFSVLEWPEDRPVDVVEMDDVIIVTWPLSPELESLDAYKPDYTARAFLDKNTKEVRLFVGG